MSWTFTTLKTAIQDFVEDSGTTFNANIDNFIDICPEAIGLFFVLSTFWSNFLSDMSFTMQPADLIKTEPKKNNIK